MTACCLALLPGCHVLHHPWQATGRKKLIAGIITDVCVLFPTLSALAEGYEVHVVVDASGTFSEAVRDAPLTRASAAGAVLINWFAVACELQKDWRLGPNSGQVGGVHHPGGRHGYRAVSTLGDGSHLHLPACFVEAAPCWFTMLKRPWIFLSRDSVCPGCC